MNRRSGTFVTHRWPVAPVGNELVGAMGGKLLRVSDLEGAEKVAREVQEARIPPVVCTSTESDINLLLVPRHRLIMR